MKEKCWIVLTILLVTLDQVLKNLVRTFLTYREEVPLLKNFLSLTYVENRGGAFSLLNGMPALFLFFSIGVILFLLYYCISQKTSFKMKNILSFILGGAIGNLIDRLLFGKVTDYIAFQFGFYHFPVFNFADSCIVFGVFIILLLELRREQNGN